MFSIGPNELLLILSFNLPFLVLIWLLARRRKLSGGSIAIWLILTLFFNIWAIIAFLIVWWWDKRRSVQD